MVSLVKNQTVSLSKESSALSQLHFGLGWDPVKKKRSLEDCWRQRLNRSLTLAINGQH